MAVNAFWVLTKATFDTDGLTKATLVSFNESGSKFFLQGRQCPCSGVGLYGGYAALVPELACFPETKFIQCFYRSLWMKWIAKTKH